MSPNRAVPRVRIGLAGFLVLAALPTICFAQTPSTDTKPRPKPARIVDLSELNRRRIDLELKDATLRSAMRKLLALAPCNYVCAIATPDVNSITLYVKGVPFEGALVSILRSAAGTPLYYAADGGILTIGPAQPSSIGAESRISLDFEGVDVRYAIRALLTMAHANFATDQEVSGAVTVKVDSAPWSDAMNQVLKACPRGPRADVENGVYHIRRAGQ